MPRSQILIIDDDDGDRMLLRRLLAATGQPMTVTEATGPDAAFALETDHFDAIFLDQLLPGRTGISCLADLAARWPRAAIFLMTGQGDEEVAKTAILRGASDYIAKSALSQNALSRMLSNGIAAARTRWKLEEQRRDLALFTEVLVHDFRAPIRAVTFLADQIAEDMAAGEAEEVTNGLRLLGKSARAMSDMLASLSDHIRHDREAAPEEVPAASVIDRALTALDRDIADSGAGITLAIDPAMPPVPCFPAPLAQVIQNLVANAIKYTAPRPAQVTIGAELTESGNYGFRIADNGPGVPEDLRERIFEPFKRGPGVQAAGTGLGLATCRKIVARHDGRIWCEAAPDGGALFRVVLPRRLPDERPALAPNGQQ